MISKTTLMICYYLIIVINNNSEIEVDKLFLTQGHREAISRMTYAVTNRMFMLFTGEYGLGKSTVLRCLKYKLESSKYEVLYLNQSKATARSLYLE